MKCVQGVEFGDLPAVFRFIMQDGGSVVVITYLSGMVGFLGTR
jgi:hypothetical protein